MYKLLLFVVIFGALAVNCLDAPRDNKYDPGNPDRVQLAGTVYELGVHSLEGAVVQLMKDGEIIAAETSSTQGSFEFNEIASGIYSISAETRFYAALQFFPESLWAGQDIQDFDIAFCTFHFDDDEKGASKPHRFESISDMWEIVDDMEQPEEHSVPHVYRGTDSDASGYALSLCDTELEQFLFETKLKVLASSGTKWQAGVVFRYQDPDNYYSISIAPETTFCKLVKEGQDVLILYITIDSAKEVWYSLKVEYMEGYHVITVYGRSGLLFALIDTVFTGGMIGVFSHSDEQAMMTSVNFDDITICTK